MSHAYRMRIEVRNVKKADDEKVLDEIVPKWWSGDYGREGSALWVDGSDRLVGGGDLNDFHRDLTGKLRELLGYHVKVAIFAKDKEGPNAGDEYEFK